MGVKHKVYLWIALGLVLACVLVGVTLLNRPASPNITVATNTGLAWGVVHELAQAVDGQGRVVLLLDQSAISTPVLLNAIHAELKKYPQLLIETVEWLDGYFVDWPETEPLRPVHFLEIVERHKGVTALVSFVGIPSLSRAQVNQMGDDRPLLMAVYLTDDLPEDHFRSASFVDVTILSNLGKRPLTEFLPSTPREWFEREYWVARRVVK